MVHFFNYAGCILLRWLHKDILPFAVILLIVVASDGFDLLQTPLPSDRQHAQLMVREGILDTVLWMQLEPFYHRPLQVPTGELLQLQEIFPEYADELPSECEVLERYQPWNTSTVDRFLTDYPLVGHCRSILRFDIQNLPMHGSGSLFIYPLDTAREHSMRLAFTPDEKITVKGDLDLTSSSARFRRRFVRFRISPSCDVHAGNAVLFRDRGLLFGRFGGDPKNSIDELRNIAYGSTNYWNGVTAKLEQPRFYAGNTGTLNAFAHARPSEKIGGILLGIRRSNNFTGEVGMVQSQIAEDAAPQRTMVVKTHFSLQRYRSLLIAGIVYDRWFHVPFIWENRLKTGGYSVNVTCTRMPAAFDASLSRIRNRFAHEMDFPKDTFPEPVTLLQTRISQYKRGQPAFSPGASIWFTGTMAHHADLHLNVTARTRIFKSRFRFVMRFADRKPEESFQKNSRIEGMMMWMLPGNNTLETGYAFPFTSEEFNYFRGSVRPVIALLSGGVLIPECNAVFSGAADNQLMLGCGFRQKLFRKTFSEIRIEKIFVEGGPDEAISIEGNASFLF